MATHLKPTSFDQLDGWLSDDHVLAMHTFLKSARRMVEKPYETQALNISSQQLVAISKSALNQKSFSRDAARSFFEFHFQPCEIVDTEKEPGRYSGFVTAYYEPEISASRSKAKSFSAPLYSRPVDLIDVPADETQNGWDKDFRFARIRQTENNSDFEYDQYPDRKAIEEGYLQGQNLEIAWVKDKVEALFIQIQGSARLRLEDNRCIRVGYAAKSGHPYTAVGKILLDLGALSRKDCGMQAIRNWFHQNPDHIDQIINQNRSFIFFKEYSVDKQADSENEGPMGAAMVNLTAGRSLAVDRKLHTFGTPVWIDCEKSLPRQKAAFQKLMIAQDTGSAIVGPSRGDLFLGSGDDAGAIAGDVRHSAKFIAFAPRSDC